MAMCEPQGEKNPRGQTTSTLWLAALSRASSARARAPGSQSVQDCSVQNLGTFLPRAPHRDAAPTDSAAARVPVLPRDVPVPPVQHHQDCGQHFKHLKVQSHC